MPPTAAAIRSSIGDLSHIRTACKAGARLAQAFSSTKQTIRLRPEQVTQIADVLSRDGLCFTDGGGVISRRLAEHVAKAVDPQITQVPSAFQIRYQGAKGVVSVCPEPLEASLQGSFDLALRPSQIKFPGHGDEVAVCSVASRLPFYFNRGIIPVLVAGGVDAQAFLDLLAHCSGHLHAARSDSQLALSVLRMHARHDRDLIRLLEAGFDIRREPNLRSFVGCVIDRLMSTPASASAFPLSRTPRDSSA